MNRIPEPNKWGLTNFVALCALLGPLKLWLLLHFQGVFKITYSILILVLEKIISRTHPSPWMT